MSGELADDRIAELEAAEWHMRGQRDHFIAETKRLRARVDGELSPRISELESEVERLRLSDADRAALATASAELRERRMNWAATYSRVALEQQDNTVTDSYRRTIAEVTAAIEVVDRLRGAK